VVDAIGQIEAGASDHKSGDIRSADETSAGTVAGAKPAQTASA